MVGWILGLGLRMDDGSDGPTLVCCLLSAVYCWTADCCAVGSKSKKAAMRVFMRT